MCIYIVWCSLYLCLYSDLFVKQIKSDDSDIYVLKNSIMMIVVLLCVNLSKNVRTIYT